MGARGPTPKPDGQRQRRNAVVPMTELTLGNSPIKAPPLPGRTKFLKQTRDWYDVWCRSPQASQLTGPSWQRLHMLAFLVDEFFKTHDKALLAEIRANEKELGATPEAMQRLRWTFKAPPPAAAEPSSSAPARKRKRTDPRLRLVQ